MYDLNGLTVHHIPVANGRWYSVGTFGKNAEVATEILDQLGFTAKYEGTTVFVLGDKLTWEKANRVFTTIHPGRVQLIPADSKVEKFVQSHYQIFVDDVPVFDITVQAPSAQAAVEAYCGSLNAHCYGNVTAQPVSVWVTLFNKLGGWQEQRGCVSDVEVMDAFAQLQAKYSKEIFTQGWNIRVSTEIG